MRCYGCGGRMQPINEGHWYCLDCGSIYPSIFKNSDIPSEIWKQPEYADFPRMFEDMLIAVLKSNHLYVERVSKQNMYGEDLEIRKEGTNEVIFYTEVEYDSSCKLFTEDGKIFYEYINIPARKMHRFNRERPAVYVKGNIKRERPICFVLSGQYIKINAKGPILLPCKFKSAEKQNNDWFYRVLTADALKQGQIRIGSLINWLRFVKEIYYLDSIISGVITEELHEIEV